MAASAITPTAGHSIQTCGNEKSKKSRRKPRLKLVSATNSTATRYSSRAFFAEDQGVYVVTVSDASLSMFLAEADKAGVQVQPIGRTCANRLVFELTDSDYAIPLETLRAAHEGFFPALMCG